MDLPSPPRKPELENSSLIGATKFAGAYGSFWKSATPTLDLFVRRINLDLYVRDDVPVELGIDPTRSALVAETAFEIFSQLFTGDEIENDFFERVIEAAKGAATRRLKLLNAENLDPPFSNEERAATEDIYGRLFRFFTHDIEETIHVRPIFPGCGFIDRSEGDVIVGSALYEIKSVERTFRSVDLKQLITYAMLNHKSGAYGIDSIGLYNPRRGTYFEMTIDEVCIEISGMSGIELLEQLAYSVASGEISR